MELVGGLLGIVAFTWNMFDYIWTYILSHLQIEISNEKIQVNSEEMLKVTTIVENRGNVAKKIHFAFLLIMPDDLSFDDSMLEISKHYQFLGDDKSTLGLLRRLTAEPSLKPDVINGKFIIRPLPYFYEEQFQIGNEKVKYSCVINTAGLQKNKVYNVRFVTISYHLFKTYLRYRLTSDLFIN